MLTGSAIAAEDIKAILRAICSTLLDPGRLGAIAIPIGRRRLAAAVFDINVLSVYVMRRIAMRQAVSVSGLLKASMNSRKMVSK